jgi:3-oxoacyl-[acyl-carrier protein] reductase
MRSSAENAFSGRVALITGASGGIGGAVARRLVDEGAVVALAYGANAEPAEQVADEIVGDGGRAVVLQADLSAPDTAGALVASAESELGPVDILVPAAGLGGQKALEEVSVEDFDQMLAVNLRAPFLLAQRTLPGMCERGFGRVLFISSVAAFTGGLVGPHYAASKAALHGLTHFLASRFADCGVTVNALAPALISDTGMLPGEPDELAKRIPVGRLGRPDEVAELSMSLLASGYVTNQVIGIDGGMYPR